LNGTHANNRSLIKSKLRYTDFGKPYSFHLYTDASVHQLRAVIIQDKIPMDFYSSKLNKKIRMLAAIEITDPVRNTA
jgi:hypothetical protein